MKKTSEVAFNREIPQNSDTFIPEVNKIFFGLSLF